MSVSLTTLFTTPQDIWDSLSAEGVDLRQDDHNLASGQVIATSADAPVGSSSLTVTATPVALLKGTQLVFDGAGLAGPVQVQLTAAASLGATTLNISQVTNTGSAVVLGVTTTAIPSGAQARDSGVNAATGARLLVAARKGTSKVKLYCNARYNDSQLVLAGSVNDWATLYATKWLCERRAQGCPKSIMRSWEDALDEMKMVQSGQLSIEDIGTRGVDWPTVSNLTVVVGHDMMRARVEPSISEMTPTGYPQLVDWNSAAGLEW